MAKILVLDDEPEILALYQTILGPRKQPLAELENLAGNLFDVKISPKKRQENKVAHQVMALPSGEEGVKAVVAAKKERDPFSTVFIDMRMPPGMDGLQTAQQILAVDPNVEIVLVTAYRDHSREEIAQIIGEHGFFYLKKPFDEDEVRQMAEMLTFRWELERDKEKLEQEKEMFIRNMSHELRHPLHVILGACDTILNCQMNEERKTQFIKDIKMEAEQMMHLSEQLKTSDAVMSQKTVSPMDEVDIADLMHHIVRLLQAEAEKKGLALSHDLHTASTKVLGDKNTLLQVLINLTVNAINYTKTGTITLRLTEEGSSLKISVIDTGVGIPKSEQRAIFKKFYRVEEQSASVQGHGLGLDIAQNIIQSHGSEIFVRSQSGKGSEFFFSLAKA